SSVSDLANVNSRQRVRRPRRPIASRARSYSLGAPRANSLGRRAPSRSGIHPWGRTPDPPRNPSQNVSVPLSKADGYLVRRRPREQRSVVIRRKANLAFAPPGRPDGPYGVSPE